MTRDGKMGRWPRDPMVGHKYTFEPKRCGVALDQVAFGAMFGAQGRAWPHGPGEEKKREEEREKSEEEAERSRNFTV